MSENKAIAGPILAFVGGLVILIYGAAEVYLAGLASSNINLNGLPVFDVQGLSIAGWLGVLFGFIIMGLAGALAANLEYHIGLGVVIIFFSILSLISVGGGDSVGFLLGVLGGTAGIVYGPEASPPYVPPVRATPPTRSEGLPQPSNPPSSARHLCVKCGNVCSDVFTICPTCGNPF